MEVKRILQIFCVRQHSLEMKMDGLQRIKKIAGENFHDARIIMAFFLDTSRE